MTPLNFSEYHRKLLDADAARARAEVEETTRHAQALAAELPASDPDDQLVKLYHLGGHYAMIFCLWVAFVSPVLLIIFNWD